ncbi:dihydroorotate dehydrogenase electron transfer subunit [Candidatus Bathyarchaeota archaeon]|nr:dihydroorotate dehydrogenase electron transfer subunit [Candidatus Bathyarchaeota archaeon]
MNRPRIVRIQEIREENPTVKTFVFQDKHCAEAEPGQFVMVWIPRVDEVPMSLSSINSDGLSSITVAEVGEATQALHQRKVGDILGIRGPYGNGFALTSGKVMIVGGGTGLTPLVPLVESLLKLSTKISFLIGAKTRDELFFLKRIKTTISKVNVTTEDGSHGLKGLVTDLAEQILKKEEFDMIYACGPEKLMLKMFLLAEQYNTSFQASLERYIRCGIGICGSCCIGEYRICKDGPVFSGRQLRKVKTEFGFFKREADGSKVSL